MVAQVEVGPGVYALQLLEAEREVELDVGSRIGIVSQFLVVVETVVLRTHSKVHVPVHTVLLPLPEPIQLSTRFDKELHFHLLELPHPEYELTGHNLVAEGLSYLRNTERNLHPAGLLHVKIVYEYALCGLRTQVYGARSISRAAHTGLEHKIELAYVSPVAGSADRADYAAIHDYLAILGEVILVLSLEVALMHGIILCLFTEHVRIGCPELLLVEGLPEFAASLLHLLVHLLLDLCEIILDEHIRTISLLGVLVVDERVIESAYVTRCLPDLRMHENAGIDSHYILVEPGHRIPPIGLDVVLEFNTELSIVIDSTQSIIDFAGREYESILLAVCYQHLEKFFLCHSKNYSYLFHFQYYILSSRQTCQWLEDKFPFKHSRMGQRQFRQIHPRFSQQKHIHIDYP